MQSSLESGYAGAERVELYVRTYRTLLRSAGETRLRTLERPHTEMASSLHAGAAVDRPDAGALIYALQRLPAPTAGPVRRIIMGQSVEAISAALGADVSTWRPVTAPGRRRRWLWTAASASPCSSPVRPTSMTSCRRWSPCRSNGTSCTCGCAAPTWPAT
ncbi:MAG: hypothetical protein U0531_04020 [Dehalococcoidia bacterium]